MPKDNDVRLFSDHFAKMLLSVPFHERAQILSSLQFLTILPGGPDPAQQSVGYDVKASFDQVGIWRCANGSSVFSRDVELIGEWNLWANVGTFPKKKRSKRRIVFLGESVARGYLYDLHYRPAKALEDTLNNYLEARDFEVIDLARTDIGFQIADLAESTTVLEPDALVLFAGNNWFWTDGMEPLDYHCAAAVLREHGIPGLKKFAEQRLSGRVRSLILRISSWSKKHRIPVIWVIPEFNLRDWRDVNRSIPHLMGEGDDRWSEIATILSSETCLDRIIAGASEMQAIDQGTNPASFRLLAACAASRGDMAAARKLLEGARDSQIWEDEQGSVSPRIYSATSATLLEQLSLSGIAMINLQDIFASHTENALPGRELFLDYCHLTAFGIQLSMAALASKILSVLQNREVPYRNLLMHCPLPGEKARSEAAFLAAVHNAHWSQPGDIVEYYCDEALSTSPEINEVMKDFVRLQTSGCPSLMSKYSESIAASEWPMVIGYLLRNNWKQLDPVLLRAISRSLEKIGEALTPPLDPLWERNLAVSGVQTDLLDKYYTSSSLDPREAAFIRRNPELAFFRSHCETSRFMFIARSESDLVLTLTARLGEDVGSGVGELVEVCVNGGSWNKLVASVIWKTWDLYLRADLLRGGLNEITIKWPRKKKNGTKAVIRCADILATETLPDYYPSFGDIHSFTAVVVRETA